MVNIGIRGTTGIEKGRMKDAEAELKKKKLPHER